MARSATKQRIAQAQNGANHIGDKERRFFDALKNIFVGVPVEGESGYINLMRIKARYFEKVMEPRLRETIDAELQRFPDFREELFDKLYTFFRRYFTESGSIGFFFTPYHQSVYEQVYTNEQDVVLFWKTARLYYVKTDRLFQSMTVEVDGFRFHFDVSQLEHKRANEKRELIYAYKERQQDGTIVFTVHYSEKGRKTKIDDIRRAIRDALGLTYTLTPCPPKRPCRKRSESSSVKARWTTFCARTPKASCASSSTCGCGSTCWVSLAKSHKPSGREPRLAQLQALKRIAYRVIDYIAAFEDELVKIWNKPKFVLNSHYVITLDRIAAQPGGVEMLERLWAHPNMEAQLQEWRELGMVSEDFTLEDLLLPPSAASNPQQDLFEVAEARDLITNGYHLPYNPDLVERARELRRNMTPAERQLWEYLKHAPYRFLRQRPIDHFIVDFYCPALRLVIEVDGEQHYTEEGKAYDAERDTILQSYGLRVVRFRNEEVLRHFESVRQRIEAAFESPLTPSLSPLRKGGEGAGGAESPLTPPLSPLRKGGEGAGGAESPLTPPLSPLSKGGEGAGSGGIHPRYRYLPIDTKHFPDLELPIVALFDNLDEALDGWLIKSENYQALNTILPKFRGKVQTIYIDPPYNSASTEINYLNRFKHSSWIAMLDNRLVISKRLLSQAGIICVAIDDNELNHIRHILAMHFPEELGIAVVRSNPAGRSTPKGFSINHEYALFFAKDSPVVVGRLPRTEKQLERYKDQDDAGFFEWVNFRKHGGLKEESPRMYYPIYVSSDRLYWRLPKMEWDSTKREWVIHEAPSEGEVVLWPIDEQGQARRWKWTPERLLKEEGAVKVDTDRSGKLAIYIKSRMPLGATPPTWWDKAEYSATDYGTRSLKELFGHHGLFTYPKAVKLVEDCICVGSGSDDEALILDFFAGSGTTAHAVINLNREDGGRRKYILVEMADYFYTVLLPRVKKVVFSDKWKDGKAQPNGKGISHFVKYYELEQFEDALRRTRYAEDDLFTPPADEDPCQYIFLRDLKMLEALEVDLEQGTVQVDLSKLYENIDLPETLSNLTGKWIRRIVPDPNDPRVPVAVEFADGERVELRSLDWRRIKPLIWW
jgi:very-short-patch-repair endonuclease